MVTYQLLKNNMIVGYERKLKEAKEYLISGEADTILMIKGLYFGEGFHKYRMTYIDRKFKRKRV